MSSGQSLTGRKNTIFTQGDFTCCKLREDRFINIHVSTSQIDTYKYKYVQTLQKRSRVLDLESKDREFKTLYPPDQDTLCSAYSTGSTGS